MNAISMNPEGRRAAIRAGLAPRPHAGKKRALLMPSPLLSGGGKIRPGLLVLAAAVVVGYGLICLVELVENCALFGTEVARLIP